MTAKLGPWVRTLYSASVRGCPDRLTTHLLLIFDTVPSLFSLFLDVKPGTVLSFLPCLPSLLFEQLPLFLWHNRSSLAICLHFDLHVVGLSSKVDESLAFFHDFFREDFQKSVHTCISFGGCHGDGIVYISYSFI